MTGRERYVVFGMVVVFAAGLLIFALNRLSLYQNYIDLTSTQQVNRRFEDEPSANTPTADPGQQTDGENTAVVPTVNINTADLHELESLPGIGRVTALNIIDYRTENGPFTEIDDLIHVKGIGEKKLEMLKQCVTIR